MEGEAGEMTGHLNEDQNSSTVARKSEEALR